MTRSVTAGLYTYDVTFYGRDEAHTVQKRVEAMTSTAAISAAAQQIGGDAMAQHNWGVKVRLVDLEAEAKHAADYAPLYEERDDARHAFEAVGFAKVVGVIWHKHPSTGLVAYVDDPEAPIGRRAAGIYLHFVDPDTGKDNMIPWVQIPWYGDGAPHDVALAMLKAAIDTAITQ